jgi:hypothetical protein
MLRTRFFAVVVVLGLLMAPAWAQTAAPAQPTVAISNDSCPGGVQLTQIIWLREEQVIGLQLLQVLIRMGQTYTVKAELGVMPTAVVVRGIAAGQPIEERVPMGQSVKYSCGTISTTLPGQIPPTQEQPTGPQPQLPTEMPKPNITPGMSPAQLLSALQAAGAQVDVQGSETKPKLGDAADPILVSALPGGFAAVGIWVSTTGSLRVSVTYDHPNAFVWVWVVPVPNFWNTATAWSPWPGGGISVSLDRPQMYQPLTQWGNAPVPGTLFFVLIIKWEMSPMPFPFVLALSN